MTSTSQSACKSLLSSGLSPRIAYPILNEIQRWVKSNGEEWTVSRLKTLKQAYINKLAGISPVFPHDSWWSNSNDMPNGHFRNIFKMKNPQKALSALMVYSSWIAKEVTTVQRDKFYNAVSLPPIELGEEMLHSARLGSALVHKHSDRFKTLLSFIDRKVRVPHICDEEIPGNMDAMDTIEWYMDNHKTLKTDTISLESLINSFSHPMLDTWMEDNQDRLNGEGIALYGTFAMQGSDELDRDFPVGVISHIQEPGLKLRAVANPLPGFQYVLSPMGHTLYSSLGNIPEDCTFDQDKGILDAQQAMKDGIHLMCIDLSNATDSFPLSYTLELLRHTDIPASDIRLFEKVSKARWKDRIFGTVQWTRGQPLGLYPSFAAFALSHHAVVRDTLPKFYRILGDDIVIDRDAGLRLLDSYAQLGVEVSPSKTLDSPILSEFAGRLITTTSVWVQPKWRDISDNSFMDLVRRLGPVAKGFLKPRQRKIIDLFSEVPVDLHPFGLGWNPDGKPYSQRLEESQPILDRWEEKHSSYRSPSVRSLDDLRLSIMFSEFSDYRKVLDLEKDTSPLIEDFESRILHQAGVVHASFAGKPPPEWFEKEMYISDPRGITTLESLESRYGDLVVPQTRSFKGPSSL